jgi:hypothetical protein
MKTRNAVPMTSEAIFWGVDGSLMASPPPSATAGLGMLLGIPFDNVE